MLKSLFSLYTSRATDATTSTMMVITIGKAVEPSVVASVDAALLCAGAGIHGRQKHV